MRMRHIALALGFAVAAPQAWGADTGDRQIIDKALSAAPAQLRDSASVVGRDGKVLKKGSGGYTCMLTPPEAGSAPMCIDSAWMSWAEAWTAHKKDFKPASQIGLAYMLAGDTSDGGASNIDPFAAKPTADNQWVVEGPHVMILVPDQKALQGITTDPNLGQPYVMWKGTPFAHIMMPVGPRPAQREVAEGAR